MEYVTLNNGVRMPMVGFGVFQLPDGDCERCVTEAINAGYRLIDTAQAYYNEEAVGRAIDRCGIDRKELFVTTKVWVTQHSYDKARASVMESMRKLQTDYLDLVLIHQPLAEHRLIQLLRTPMLIAIARKYSKTPAQVILRFNVQRGIVVIPKSSHKERIEENIDIFDFELTDEEMQQIRTLDENKSLWLAYSSMCFIAASATATCTRHTKTGGRSIIRWCQDMRRNRAAIPTHFLCRRTMPYASPMVRT